LHATLQQYQSNSIKIKASKFYLRSECERQREGLRFESHSKFLFLYSKSLHSDPTIILKIGNCTQLMPSVGFPLKNWRLWHVCLKNKKICWHIKRDSLHQAGGRQFANSCRHVPVRILKHLLWLIPTILTGPNHIIFGPNTTNLAEVGT